MFFWFFPTYLDKDAVKAWLLSLNTNTPLLMQSDKKLPKGCLQFSGHSLASFFENCIQRAKFMWADSSQTCKEVVDHLEALARQIERRGPAKTPKPKQSQLLLKPAPAPVSKREKEEEMTRIEELELELKQQSQSYEKRLRDQEELFERRLKEQREEFELRLRKEEES